MGKMTQEGLNDQNPGPVMMHGQFQVRTIIRGTWSEGTGPQGSQVEIQQWPHLDVKLGYTYLP